MKRVVSILILLGMVALGLLILWQGPVAAHVQTRAAQERSQEWSAITAPEPEPVATPVPDAPEHGQVIGNLYVPRFGADYVRTIAEGTDDAILNDTSTGIGHYPSTQMPGEGNFAIASHRTANGGGMYHIDKLVPGDKIIVETVEGHYTYVHTRTEIVEPEQVSVLYPVPGQVTITLTSCDPIFTSENRIVAYGLFESFDPRS